MADIQYDNKIVVDDKNLIFEFPFVNYSILTSVIENVLGAQDILKMIDYNAANSVSAQNFLFDQTYSSKKILIYCEGSIHYQNPSKQQNSTNIITLGDAYIGIDQDDYRCYSGLQGTGTDVNYRNNQNCSSLIVQPFTFAYITSKIFSVLNAAMAWGGATSYLQTAPVQIFIPAGSTISWQGRVVMTMELA